MTQLLFIEIFVLGATAIAAIYHAGLYIQQKDRFLLFYSIYLFTTSAYIGFKLLSNNYNPFIPTANTGYYVMEEFLQLFMVCNYTTFAAVTLEVTQKPRMVKYAWVSFLVISALTFTVHLCKAWLIGPGVTSVTVYAVSRLFLIFIATIGLLLAWRVRTSVFQRTIIIGSIVYDLSGLLSALSFINGNKTFFGLSGVEPYLIGCFIDVIIFSGAFGYRIKLIARQKNELLKNELSVIEAQNRIGKSLNDTVGAALSSIHVYASVAEKLIEKDPEKAKKCLREINTNSLQIMDEVGDIVWALNLSPANIQDALTTRIKRYGLEILEPKNISCTYEIEPEALQAVRDITSAKNILQQIKAAMQSFSVKTTSSKVLVSVKMFQNKMNISVN
mgnify:CR=1 FL=1